MSAEARSGLRRAGVTALNLLHPGLGLFRASHGRAALIFLLAPYAALLLLGVLHAVLPVLSFRALLASVVLILAIAAAAYVGSMVLTWRWSRFRPLPPPWWTRWYGLAAVLLLGAGLNWLVTTIVHRAYKPFYIPSEAMMPTLHEGDRIVAWMRPRDDGLRRGDIVLVRAGGGSVYVKRVAALGGDRIALQGGIVTIDGVQVPQKFLGIDPQAASPGGNRPRRMAEQFPGEAVAHEIYDLGYTAVDDFPTSEVRQGHVFVLGDNRDRSADSRVSRLQFGLEQVALTDIAGRPLYKTWGARGDHGRRLGR